MMYRAYAAFGLLVVIAACSASGAVEEPKPNPDDNSRIDAAASESDAGAPDDASATIDLDAERPLVCGDAGFCETRLPRSDLGLPLSLRSVWVVGAKDVWSVTLEGFVLHYDGTSWTTAYKANHELYAVWATPSSVWVGGEAGLLFHRSAAGEWSRVEVGHSAPIRSIYGTGESDVWFTSHGGSVDHFDGTALTHHSLDIPGLQITTIFGRTGYGTYAAGHVKTNLPNDDQMVDFTLYHLPDQPFIFELSTAKMSTFSTALTDKRGFVPVSAVVTDSPNEDQRIFMVGYEHSKLLGNGSIVNHYTNMKYCSFGAESPVSFSDLYVELRVSVEPEAVARGFPILAYAWNDIRTMSLPGALFRWNGATVTTESLAMGYDFVPGAIFGAHSHGGDAWIVGDGFAVKGATP